MKLLTMDNFHNYYRKSLIRSKFSQTSFQTLILDLKELQPSILNIPGSQQISVIVSSNLYLFWLQRVVSLLDVDISLYEFNRKIYSNKVKKGMPQIEKCSEQNSQVDSREASFLRDSSFPRKEIVDINFPHCKSVFCRNSCYKCLPFSNLPSNSCEFKSCIQRTQTIDESSLIEDEKCQSNIAVHVKNCYFYPPEADKTGISNILISDPMWSSGHLVEANKGLQTSQPLRFSPVSKSGLEDNTFTASGVDWIKKELSVELPEESKPTEAFNSAEFKEKLQYRNGGIQKPDALEYSPNSPWKEDLNTDMKLSPYWKLI